ncbi:MAG: DUF1848 domain-containing protein [Treponema sp.]|nr:DUF1848 domain-containing protein [Candidatus Treponema equifaecale]
MIIFASGRTDIPAFYSKWFVNRVRAGFVDVRNPYYNQQVTRYRLDQKVVDCLVFCTKNPEPMLEYLDELKNFPLYFHVTITPYGKEVEPNVPDKNQVMENFIKLSQKLGKDHVVWRYDPIFIDENYSVAAHIRFFKEMCEKLASYTNRCIISFIDLYEKTKRNFPGVKEVSESDQKFIAGAFSSIAAKNGIQIESCAEKIDLTAQGVVPGACVSKEIVEKLTNVRLKISAKSNLRKHCICLPTRDIAYYNCCPHLCKYCYANYDEKLVRKNYALHNPESSFLIGEAKSDDIVNIAKQESFKDQQLYLNL